MNGTVNATVPLPKPTCEFLTGDDIAGAIGNPVQAATQAEAANCTWGTAVDGGTSLDLTVVKIVTAPRRSDAARGRQGTRWTHFSPWPSVASPPTNGRC
ncbi:MAG: hypothetical protein V7605_1849 [Acidimicrobiaceae bacterium]|jgi:hypothetical protein